MDIKNKKYKELNIISKQIREEIIDKTSVYGGHLSSNLGVVELTVALHRKFDFTADKVLFDVSHQTYAHKIITGRSLEGLRTRNGVSGFSKRSESPTDHFEAGHSSTSLSTAYGMAVARDLDKKKHHVVAVIGDASIANGMAFEALNNIGSHKHKVIVVLNDNEMSISQPIGGLARFLKRIRFSPAYLKNKETYRRIMFKTKFRYNLFRFTQAIKNKAANFLSPPNFFEQLGFGYIGPVNGHNIKKLEKALDRAKKSGKSIIIHVKTVKGKGYTPAECDDCGDWHGVGPFEKEAGKIKKSNGELISWSKLYSVLLEEKMSSDQDLVLITPATIKGSELDNVFKAYPSRCFDVGIAEEHAVTMAAGLALSGKKPVVSIYSTFIQRALDQLSHDVDRQNLNTLFLIDRTGLVGADGETHHGIFEQAWLLNNPNMVVSMASDEEDARNLFSTVNAYNGPKAIRFPRDYLMMNKNLPATGKITIGKWITANESNVRKTVIITYGPILCNIMASVKKEGLDITVINAIFQKPLDIEILKTLDGYENIIIHDAYATENGFVNSVKSVLVSNNNRSRIITFALKDQYTRHGTILEQMKENQVDADTLIEFAKTL